MRAETFSLRLHSELTTAGEHPPFVDDFFCAIACIKAVDECGNKLKTNSSSLSRASNGASRSFGSGPDEGVLTRDMNRSRISFGLG